MPWAEHIRVEDLILVGACLLVPCFLLAKVVAPSSKKTAADAAKDRDRMMRAAVKRQKREMKKRKGRGSSGHVSSVSQKESEPANGSWLQHSPCC